MSQATSTQSTFRRSLVGRLFVAVAAACVALPAAGGNLVPNPNFEGISVCPTTIGQVGSVNNWQDPTTGSNSSTPDYFNGCAPAPGSGPCSVGVPVNSVGTQTARSGVGYGGFILSAAQSDYREYLQVQLTAPLVVGQTYIVRFYVSLAESSTHGIQEVGAYFSNVPASSADTIDVFGREVMLFNPQVEYSNGVILIDDGWVLVSGTFVADGGEDWLVIGNFRDDASTTTLAHTPTGQSCGIGFAYYYLDDASVEQLPATYCTGSNNSTGAGADLSFMGSVSVSANNLVLSASNLPTNQFGLFFYGANQIEVPFGNGFRCVGGQIFRLNVHSSGAAGVLEHSMDFTSPPQPAGMITPGSTWNFQAWYRDTPAGGAGFNLSNGLELTFDL